jgi:hypothetical protein
MFSQGKLRLFFAAAVASTAFVACSDKAENPVEVVINQDKDALSESSREEALQKLRAKLGTDIAVDTEDKEVAGYSNEGRANRVIREITAHSDELKDHLKGVSKILVSSNFDSKRIGENLVLYVRIDASEQDIVDFIKNSVRYKAIDDTFDDLASRLHVKAIRNLKTMDEATAKAMAEKLTEAAKTVDFSKHSIKILISDRFTTSIGGRLTIPKDASQEELSSFFKASIEVIREGVEVMRVVNEKLSPKNVMVMEETFTPTELKTALDNLKINVDILKSADKVITRFVLGKRFESDKILAHDSTEALIDYRITGAEVLLKLEAYKKDLSTETDTSISILKAFYADAGVAVSLQGSTNHQQENLDRLNRSISDIQRVLPADRAKELLVKSIVLSMATPNAQGNVSSVSITNQVVYVTVMSFEAVDLERALADLKAGATSIRRDADEGALRNARTGSAIGQELAKATEQVNKLQVSEAAAKAQADALAKQNAENQKAIEELKKKVEELSRGRPIP